MSVYPKFIIETDSELGDCLIIAKCTYHKQLASDVTKIKGGGWWTLKDEILTLHGDSYDFGAAEIEDIARCIQDRQVFSSFALYRNLTDKYTFQYRTESGEIINLEK